MEGSPKSSRWKQFIMRLGIIGELLTLFSTGERWWMAPLVLLLCIIGMALVLLQSFEFIAPFVYMAF
jgi:hypothetical protein